MARTTQEVKLPPLIHLYKQEQKDQDSGGEILLSINSLCGWEENRPTSPCSHLPKSLGPPASISSESFTEKDSVKERGSNGTLWEYVKQWLLGAEPQFFRASSNSGPDVCVTPPGSAGLAGRSSGAGIAEHYLCHHCVPHGSSPSHPCRV